LLYSLKLARNGLVDRLCFSGGPADDGFFHLRKFPKAEMQAALILRGETATAGNLLNLMLTVPEKRDLRSDRAAVAARAFEFKLDPLVFRRDGVLVDQQRAALVGHHHIQHAA